MASFKIGDHIKFFNDFNEICYAMIEDINDRRNEYVYSVYKRANVSYQHRWHCSITLMDKDASLVRRSEYNSNHIWEELNA